MADRFSAEVRSRVMASVKSKNTSVERLIFSGLRKRGIYFQKHYKVERYSADIAIPSKRLAVFINGDFWHGYRYKQWSYRLNSEYWRQKIENNIRRDRKVARLLKSRKWQVLRVWEHEINDRFDQALDEVANFLLQDNPKL